MNSGTAIKKRAKRIADDILVARALEEAPVYLFDAPANYKERRMAQAIVKQLAQRKSDHAIDAMLHYIYRGFYGRVSTEEKSEKEKDMYVFPYIPYYPHTFVRTLVDVAVKRGKKRFIDVGSGLGDKLALAKYYGKFDKVHGIEINAHTYELSLFFLRKWFHNDMSLQIFRQDAFEFSFENYDVAYMYMPINDRDMLNELHLHVINTLPVGGILIEVGASRLEGQDRWVHTRANDCPCSDDCTCEEWECECECKHDRVTDTWQEIVGDRLTRKVSVTHDHATIVEILE